MAAADKGQNTSVSDADKAKVKMPLQQIVIQVTDKGNWEKLLAEASQLKDDEGTPLTVHKMVKTLVFSTYAGLDRDKEKERKTGTAEPTLVERILGDEAKGQSRANLQKAEKLAKDEMFLAFTTGQTVSADDMKNIMRKILSNVARAEANSEANKLTK